MSDLLNQAIRYSKMGWSLVPVKLGTKEAAVRWKRYQTERATEATVRRWCEKDIGLAVVGGPVSGGLVIRDFDDAGAYDRWATDHADLAARLPTVQTARGHHVYARMATDVGTIHCGDGEIRGHGAYTLLPPSVHPSGQIYRWLIEPHDGLPTVDSEVFGVGVLKEAKDVKEDKEVKDNKEVKDINGIDTTSFDALIERFPIDGSGKGRNALKRLALTWLAERQTQKPPQRERVLVHSLWWERFGHHRRTDEESSFEDFDRMLDELRGDSFLTRVRWALPTVVIPEWAIDEPDHRQRVAAVIVACNHAAEGKAFPLAATIAAQLAELPDPKTAHRALHAFCRKEHVPLQLVQRGERRPGGKPNVYRLTETQR
jgi:hypothetical protein